MSVIKVENLTFSYDTSYDKIFDNVSFQIDTNWKLGFVGRNGRGKTTFLNLLLGRYEYQGRILSSVQFDYFPYEVKDKNVRTEEVLREVCPVAETWEFMRELSYLSMEAEVLEKPFGLLSQGEQTKALKQETGKNISESFYSRIKKRKNFQIRHFRSQGLCCFWGFLILMK